MILQINSPNTLKTVFDCLAWHRSKAIARREDLRVSDPGATEKYRRLEEEILEAELLINQISLNHSLPNEPAN